MKRIKTLKPTPLFYAPDIDDLPILPEGEAVHALRVLRLQEGSEITVTDGKGFFYLATIWQADPRQCEVTVLKRWQPEPAVCRIHLAVAPTKHAERMEWMVEKATEIGIDAVTLLNCHFSERREMKTFRLEKAAVSAMKQSQRAFLPALTGMTLFCTFIGQPFDGRKFIACYNEKDRMQKPLLSQLYHPGEHALILIGPEGGFSPEEIIQAMESGFMPVSLGPSRLRTETAALVACHTVHVLNQEKEIQKISSQPCQEENRV
ncbi:MAG: 16S rRNA (uracil(1498)-N(3))-methyltransferase [Tannerella sp.]|nr:16S rRNA (uracil(1498)-N(3))-methyltransferase [Tannerella sp.]